MVVPPYIQYTLYILFIPLIYTWAKKKYKRQVRYIKTFAIAQDLGRDWPQGSIVCGLSLHSARVYF